jgi:VWFA-related protein
MLRHFLVLAAIFLAFQDGAQLPQAPPQPRFRVTQDLVTIDAVVTGDGGEPVLGLGPDDFELEYEGKRYPARQVAYIDTPGPTNAAAAAVPLTPAVQGNPSSPAPAPATPAAADAGGVSRTVAVVVDDLGLSWESTYRVRRALSQFVDSQVQPNDLVAILRTSAGVGALQQFTRDRRLLHAAVDRVRWTVQSRTGITAFTPAANANMPVPAGPAPEDGTDVRNEYLAAGSLASLDYVIRGVGQLPGRKAVVFLSEGIDLFGTRMGRGGLWETFARLMDRANRAGVVVYTIDARGLATGGLTAEDDPQPKDEPLAALADPDGSKQREAIVQAMTVRREYLRNTQEALNFMAVQTGGLAVRNANDLNRGLARVLNDLKGYYLIGYEAPPGGLASWERAAVRVRVKRPGMKVRSRQGSFGPARADRVERFEERDPVLFAALSPFNGGTLPVRVRAAVIHTSTEGFLLRSQLFLEGRDLVFTETPDGSYEAEYEIGEFVVGDNGTIPASARRRLSLRFDREQHRKARAEGLIYTVALTLREAGAYQLRVGVRDTQAKAVGSASQYLEVPRVGKGRLAMSGVLLSARPAVRAASGSPATGGADDGPGGQSVTLPPGVFRAGEPLMYAYEIYDGAKAPRGEALTTRITILRDGRAVASTGDQEVPRPDVKKDVRVIPVVGQLETTGLQAGTYGLEITVSGGSCRCTTSQVTEFEYR